MDDGFAEIWAGDGEDEPSFLESLKQSELAALELRARKRVFRRASTLFHEGDTSERVVVVLEGRVKISYFTEDGREVLLAIRGPGELLGEQSALDGRPHSATASGVDDVHALSCTRMDFLTFLEENPRVALFLLEVLSKRLRDADMKRIEFASFDSVGRLARRLVELTQRFGEESRDGIRINIPLSQEELAGWIGSSREAVSKALQLLRARGLIETHRRGITVKDLPALAERAT